MIGGAGKSGSLALAAARDSGAGAHRRRRARQAEADLLAGTGLADEVALADARDPVALAEAVEAAGGRPTSPSSASTCPAASAGRSWRPRGRHRHLLLHGDLVLRRRARCRGPRGRRHDAGRQRLRARARGVRTRAAATVPGVRALFERLDDEGTRDELSSEAATSHTPADPARRRRWRSRTARSCGPATTTQPSTSWTTPTGSCELEGRLVTPAFVDAHTHLAETGLAAARRRPHRQRVRCAEALDRCPRPSAGADARCSATAGTRPRWPEGAASRGTSWTARPTAAPSTCPASTSTRPSSPALAAAVPARVDARRSDDGRVERDAAPRRPQRDAAASPRDAASSQVEALESAAAARHREVHEMAAPHIASEDDFARDCGAFSDELAAHPEVVWLLGRRSTIAAGPTCSDASATRPATSAPTARSGRTPLPCDAPYADDVSTSGHLYLSRRAGRRARRGLHRGRAAGGLPRDRRPRGGRRSWPGSAGRGRDDRPQAVVTDGTGSSTSRWPTRAARRARPARASRPACSRCSTPGGAASGGLYASGWAERRQVAEPVRLDEPGRHGAGSARTAPVTPYDPWAAVRAAAWHHHDGPARHGPGGLQRAHRGAGGPPAVMKAA